jgi:hypothetical protein
MIAFTVGHQPGRSGREVVPMTSTRDEGRHWLAEELLWEQTLARLRSKAEDRIAPPPPDQPVDDGATREREQNDAWPDQRPRVPESGHRVA